MGNAMGVLGQRRQGFALFWGAADTRVFEAGARGYLPEPFLTSLGRVTLAQQHWQRPAQGVAQAVLVILGCPQAQFE
ncbi:hypothetical protein D9M71_231250 [compost metagenome]